MPLFTMTLSNNLPVDLALVATMPFLATFGVAVLWAIPWFLTERGRLWLVLILGVPLAVAVVSWLWTPIYLNRALLPSVLAFMPIMAKFLVENRRTRWLWRGMTAFSLLLALVGMLRSGGNTQEGRDMQQFCAGADVIYNTGLSTAFISRYYVPDIQSYLAPTVRTDQGMKLADYALDALDFQIADNSTGPEWIKQFLEPGSFISTQRTYTNFYNIDYYRIFVS
jgi:hypothetical protein